MSSLNGAIQAYQWKVSEAEEFWEDLNSYFQENKANPETKGSLFLGTFIFLDQGSSSFEIYVNMC